MLIVISYVINRIYRVIISFLGPAAPPYLAQGCFSQRGYLRRLWASVPNPYGTPFPKIEGKTPQRPKPARGFLGALSAQQRQLRQDGLAHVKAKPTISYW